MTSQDLLDYFSSWKGQWAASAVAEIRRLQQCERELAQLSLAKGKADASPASLAIESPFDSSSPSLPYDEACSHRLQHICNALGLQGAVPKDCRELWEVRFAVLGMIRREVTALASASGSSDVALAKQAVAAPVALSDAINCLMDFAPCKRAQPEGMTRGGAYVRKADVLAILAAAPQPTDADKRDAEPDMLWDAADTEAIFATDAQNFAEQYAGNCMSSGDVSEVVIECGKRLPNRKMRIEVTSDENDWLKWEWVDDSAIAASAKEAK